MKILLGAIALLSLTTLVPPATAAPERPATPVARRHAKLPPGILFDCRKVKGNWKLNGLYGPFTVRAVMAFQRAGHLVPDGVVGLQTDRALGLRFTRKLRCGMGGRDVYLVQRALLARGFWYGGHGHAAPVPAPPAVPSPPLAPSPSLPSSGWQRPPVLYTPGPAETPEPVVPSPSPAPSATPRPLVLAPAPASPGPSTAWTAAPVTIALAAWQPGVISHIGVAGVVAPYATLNIRARSLRLRVQAAGLPNVGGPPSTTGTPSITDWSGPLLDFSLGSAFGPNSEAFVGYRGFPGGTLQFGLAGLGVHHGLGASWANFDARFDAGLGAAGASTYNAQAAFEFSGGPVTVSLGYRHLTFVTGSQSATVSGPLLQLGIGL